MKQTTECFAAGERATLAAFDHEIIIRTGPTCNTIKWLCATLIAGVIWPRVAI